MMAGGVPCARYQTVAEAIDDAQAQARGLMARVGDGDRAFRVPNPPFMFTGTDLSVGSAVPAIGEHTEEILGKMEPARARTGP